MNRFRYAAKAARQARSIAANRVQAALFMLLPERLANCFLPACKFQLAGLPFFARRSDWTAVNQVVLHREYDFTESLFSTHEHPRVLDVGANIGTFALHTFSLRPGAEILSVEPSAPVYWMLERNRAANAALAWYTERAALWSSAGELRFETAKRSSMSGHISDQGTEIVPATTLELVARQHSFHEVDVLKMDLEGAEEAVLAASEAYLGRVRSMIIQVHPRRCNAERVFGLLRRHFPYLSVAPDRLSANPLIVATRQPWPLSWDRL